MKVMTVKYWIEKKLGIVIKNKGYSEHWNGEKRNVYVFAKEDNLGWYLSFTKEGKNVGLELNCYQIKDEKILLKHINKFIRLSKCR